MVTLAKQTCHEVGNDLAGHVNVAELCTKNLYGFTTGVGENVVEIPRIAVCQGVHFQTPLSRLVFAILLALYPALEANHRLINTNVLGRVKVGLKSRHQAREKGLDLTHAAWHGPRLGGEMEHPEDVQEAILRHHIMEKGDAAHPLHLTVGLKIRALDDPHIEHHSQHSLHVIQSHTRHFFPVSLPSALSLSTFTSAYSLAPRTMRSRMSSVMKSWKKSIGAASEGIVNVGPAVS